MKFFALALVVVVVIGGVWLGFKYLKKTPGSESATQTSSKQGDIVVTKTDLTQSGGSRLPEGFPGNIPVEVATITEGYKAFYKNLNATQYTVSYTSKKSRDDLWTLYSNFMDTGGYTLDKTATSKSLGQLSGTHTGDNLMVIISVRSGLSFVQMSYTDR